MSSDHRAGMRIRSNTLAVAHVLCAGCWLSGCAVNPVSGRNDFVMMSESLEITEGRAAKDDSQTYAYDRDFLSTARSVHPITAQERSQAHELKIHLQRATLGTRCEDLASRSPVSDHPLEQLRLINGLYPNGEPVPGSWVKVVN